MNYDLSLSSLSASYQSARGEMVVFKNLNINLKRGEILGIFGPNGCGKTTLLRVLAGLKTAAGGEIAYPAGAEEVQISMIRQHYQEDFFTWLNVLNNLAMVLPQPIGRYKSNINRILELKNAMRLDVDLRRNPSECSGGQLQQAAIVRAFAANPVILLADEPFSSLDVSVSHRVRSAFVEQVRRQGLIAFVVLHHLQDIVEVCDLALAIPGIPFSTESNSDDFLLAEIVKNESRLQGEDLESSSFSQILKRVLAYRGS